MTTSRRAGLLGGAPQLRLLLLLAAMASTACIERFDSPSLYIDDPLPCGGADPAAIEERLQACWAKPGASCAGGPSDIFCECLGVISLQGKLDARPFRFDAELLFALADVEQPAEIINDAGVSTDAFSNATEEVNKIALTGHGPYFSFSLRLKDLPGRWIDLPITEKKRYTLPYAHPDSNRTFEFLVDRLDAQGEATRPDFSGAEGWFEFQLQSQSEYRASFSVRAAESVLEGCFATKIVVVR